MFLHNFKNTFMVIIRDRFLIFWSLVFPIILGFFFTIALGNMFDSWEFEPINVSVSESLRDDIYFNEFLDELEDEKIIKIHEGEKLSDGEITAYIKDYDKIVFKKSGIYESLMENILNNYLRKANMYKRISKEKAEYNIANLDVNRNHFVDKSRKNLNIINTFFYSLIGMQALYGYSLGLMIIYKHEANLSTLARRNSVAPIRKTTNLFSSLLAGFLINFIIVLFTIFVFNRLYGVDFSNKLLPLIFLVALASVFGVLFGILIGVSNKATIEIKNGIGIAITMLLSYLSGMMNSDTKIIIQEKFPIIFKLNPVSLINDGMYSLYYYDGLERYWQDIKYLSLLILVFGFISFIYTKGKQYDSI